MHVRFNEKNPKGSEGIESAVGSVACGVSGGDDEESRERTDVEAYATRGAAKSSITGQVRDVSRLLLVV